MTVYKLSEKCSVAGQIGADDIEALKRAGYVAVICNRPDGEDFGQPTAESVGARCERDGIGFHCLPISGTGITAEMIEQFRKIIAESEGPVLAYCRSGQRSSLLWHYSGAP